MKQLIQLTISRIVWLVIYPVIGDQGHIWKNWPLRMVGGPSSFQTSGPTYSFLAGHVATSFLLFLYRYSVIFVNIITHIFRALGHTFLLVVLKAVFTLLDNFSVGALMSTAPRLPRIEMTTCYELLLKSKETCAPLTRKIIYSRHHHIFGLLPLTSQFTDVKMYCSLKVQ